MKGNFWGLDMPVSSLPHSYLGLETLFEFSKNFFKKGRW
jgi:hypothetical protein